MAQIDIREGGAIPEKQVKQLFEALGWTEFDGLLPELLLNSTHVVSAWDGARLVGMARVVSDRVLISTLQQVGVHPDYQRQGLGSELVRRCIAQFDHTQFILTIDEESNATFYSRFGFSKTADAMIRPRTRNPAS